MTQQEKREELKLRLVRDLRRRVRPHRPAAKVLEITVAIAEDQLERMKERIIESEWELDYLKGLDPAEIEKGDKS